MVLSSDSFGQHWFSPHRRYERVGEEAIVINK